MPDQKFAIKTERLITPLQDIRNAVVFIEAGKIAAGGRQTNHPIPESFAVLDVGSKMVSPGFIDIHNHGGMGVLANDGKGAVQVVRRHLVKSGCTGWLPTVNNLECLPGIVEAMQESSEGAEVIGIHMEGPFLAPKNIHGIQGLDQGLEKPSIERFMQFVEAADGHLKLMGLALEFEGSLELIREMRKVGVIPAAAHTKVTYERFMQAVEAGIRHVTHTYNVMSGLHHRQPGVLGGALTCDQVTAELISDGFHVSPPAMDILIRCKGIDKVCLITDNTAIAGLPDGNYELHGRSLVKQDGVCRFAGASAETDHTMAGSEWPINHNIYTMIDRVGVKTAQAIQMATLNPAKVIGVDRRIGSIEPGNDANLTVLDDAMNVYLTMIKGEIVYEAE